MKIDMSLPKYSWRKFKHYKLSNIRKWKKDRTKYGVADYDVWGFDHFLFRILTNGLTMLEENLHGFPGGEWTFESWKAEIRRQVENARWLAEGHDREDTAIYNKYWSKYDRDDMDIMEFLNTKLPPEEDARYKAELHEQNERFDWVTEDLMSFLKQNIHALWD